MPETEIASNKNKTLVEKENSKEDVIAYINELDSSISKLDKNIYTDNLAINSILMNKNKVAEDKGIKVSLDLMINSKLKVSNIDICTVLGNLLDNSIEACELINGYKFIATTSIVSTPSSKS